MTQGEIWFVKFLNSVGHEYRKNRPALIIKDNFKDKNNNIITIIPFTSNLNNKIKDDILIVRNNQNGLYSNSLLKVNHIQSFDESRFIKKIGIIDKKILEEIKKYLKTHFGLS